MSRTTRIVVLTGALAAALVTTPAAALPAMAEDPDGASSVPTSASGLPRCDFEGETLMDGETAPVPQDCDPNGPPLGFHETANQTPMEGVSDAQSVGERRAQSWAYMNRTERVILQGNARACAWSLRSTSCNIHADGQTYLKDKRLGVTSISVRARGSIDDLIKKCSITIGGGNGIGCDIIGQTRVQTSWRAITNTQRSEIGLRMDGGTWGYPPVGCSDSKAKSDRWRGAAEVTVCTGRFS
jgi:hypothetical protein